VPRPRLCHAPVARVSLNPSFLPLLRTTEGSQASHDHTARPTILATSASTLGMLEWTNISPLIHTYSNATQRPRWHAAQQQHASLQIIKQCDSSQTRRLFPATV
jgi:hypothetical protein